MSHSSLLVISDSLETSLTGLNIDTDGPSTLKKTRKAILLNEKLKVIKKQREKCHHQITQILSSECFSHIFFTLNNPLRLSGFIALLRGK